MKWYKKIIPVIAFSLVFFSNFVLVSASAHSDEVNEYSNEFSNFGESCFAIDSFVYIESEPGILWKNQIEKLPVFYQCCKEQECTNVIIDLKNKNFFKETSYKELLDLNFIRSQISSGTLSETYFINNGLSLCDYYGDDKLGKETVNLAADASETILQTQKSKEFKQIISAIEAARMAKIVSPFSIVDFSVGSVCKYNNDKLKKSVELLAKCNSYLRNIRNGITENGYVSSLNICISQAKTDLKSYLDDAVSKMKNLADNVANFIKFFYDIFSHLDKPGQQKMEDTEYETAQKIYSELQNKQVFLNNPYKESIYRKYVTRIDQKNTEYFKNLNTTENNIKILREKIPSEIIIYLNNIFKNPDYKKETLDSVKDFEISLDKCKVFYSELKFNSAIKCLEDSEVSYKSKISVVENELNIDKNREYDVGVIFLVSSIVFTTIFLFLGARKKGYFYGHDFTKKYKIFIID